MVDGEEVVEPRERLVVRAVITRKDGTVEDLGVISQGDGGDWVVSNGKDSNG